MENFEAWLYSERNIIRFSVGNPWLEAFVVLLPWGRNPTD